METAFVRPLIFLAIFAIGYGILIIIKKLLSEHTDIDINPKSTLGIIFLMGGLVNIYAGFSDDESWLFFQGTILLSISIYLLSNYLVKPYKKDKYIVMHQLGIPKKNKKINNSAEKKKDIKNKEIPFPLYLKPLWKSIIPFLNSRDIYKFYHFTDKKNLQSIIDIGGLYSWKGLQERSINTSLLSNDISRNLDIKNNLEYYVRLSFVHYHPMSTKVHYENNTELIWLEIDTQIALSIDTLFSNINATDNNVAILKDFNDLKIINYNVFKKKYSNLTYEEKKQYQAEIMVKDFLPIAYITNLESLKERYL